MRERLFPFVRLRCQVKTPPGLSPGAWRQAIIERKEWSAFVLSDTIVCNRRGRFFYTERKMPVIETWGRINCDPGILPKSAIRTCIVWTGHFVF